MTAALASGKILGRVTLQRSVFVILIWMLSRAVVAAGLGVFSGTHLGVVQHFDGEYYRRIATNGYTYSPDGRYYSVAFFPLYPAFVALLMRTGLTFDMAATIIANLSFLSMLWFASEWVESKFGVATARWTVAFMAFFPMSLFGSLAYTEGPYMLLSLLALRDFDGGRYVRAGLWSGLASLARPSALWLIPAFVAAAFIEKRGVRALPPALAVAIGIAAFSIFCRLRFGDAFAFIREEQIWRHGLVQGWHDWGILLGRGTVLFQHWKFQLQVLPIAAALVLTNRRLPSWLATSLWSVVVFTEHWCWDRDFASAIILILGGAMLLCFRRQLGVASVTYGLVAIISLAFAGSPLSVDRLLFGVVPLSISIGAFLSSFPTVGPALLWACTYDLFEKSAAFATNNWVA
jgi:hypothetical protein